MFFFFSSHKCILVKLSEEGRRTISEASQFICSLQFCDAFYSLVNEMLPKSALGI